MANDDFAHRVVNLIGDQSLLKSQDFNHWCDTMKHILTPAEAAEQWPMGAL